MTQALREKLREIIPSQTSAELLTVSFVDTRTGEDCWHSFASPVAIYFHEDIESETGYSDFLVAKALDHGLIKLNLNIIKDVSLKARAEVLENHLYGKVSHETARILTEAAKARQA